MRILLDTHIALWAIANTSKLSDEVIELLEKESNEVFYSMASVWEVAIKHIIKPENMPVSEEEFVRLCEDTGFTDRGRTYFPVKDVITTERYTKT